MRTITRGLWTAAALLLAGPRLAAQIPAEPFAAPPYDLTAADFAIDGDLGSFDGSLSGRIVEPGVMIVTVRLAAPAAAPPPRFSVRWSLPSVDVAGFWNSNVSIDKVNYYRSSVDSRVVSGAPVLTLYNAADRNRLTFAVSDARNPIRLDASLQEEDARFHFGVTFFRRTGPALSTYHAEIRVDTRPVPFYRALAAVSDWWADQPDLRPAPVPDAAVRPAYSTWYAFHQHLDPTAILAELRLARDLGYGTVIVDDGWQTLDTLRGYRYTGDWSPDRIPNMRAFVDSVHALDMRFVLWYAVPFIGEAARNFARFEGKYLRYWESQGAYVLDPRFPEVRAFLADTYDRAMVEWSLDGFKLDFIDFFAADDSTVVGANGGRDIASVDEAVEQLLRDVTQRLRARNPDVLIEFRQRYVGPSMRQFGNMFRGVDAPNNAAANRAEITDLRLLAGNTAVHSDMIMWHPDEPVEVAAQQLLAVLFAVPQLSVRLTALPASHRRMVAFWTDYWNDQRGLLLGGEFAPANPGAVYPLIKAVRGPRVIVGVYGDLVVPLDEGPYRDVHLINGKASTTIVVDLRTGMGTVELDVLDAEGTVIERRSRGMPAGVYQFRVPAGGLIRIVRM